MLFQVQMLHNVKCMVYVVTKYTKQTHHMIYNTVRVSAYVLPNGRTEKDELERGNKELIPN
jgi:hypothetical protein